MPINRGDIYLASLDPVVGNEISKTRPVIVVSNNINNRYAGTVTVLPITSRKLKKTYPFELALAKGTGNLPKDSKVKADQIRTLDRTRLVKNIGKLNNEHLSLLNEAIKIHLAL
jgi:mRNA interferase MazF